MRFRMLNDDGESGRIYRLYFRGYKECYTIARLCPAHTSHKVSTVRSESRCALRLRYVDLVVSIEVSVEVCCCFAVFSC
jgi:hypothetical protein